MPVPSAVPGGRVRSGGASRRRGRVPGSRPRARASSSRVTRRRAISPTSAGGSGFGATGEIRRAETRASRSRVRSPGRSPAPPLRTPRIASISVSPTGASRPAPFAAASRVRRFDLGHLGARLELLGPDRERRRAALGVVARGLRDSRASSRAVRSAPRRVPTSRPSSIEPLDDLAPDVGVRRALAPVAGSAAVVRRSFGPASRGAAAGPARARPARSGGRPAAGTGRRPPRAAAARAARGSPCAAASGSSTPISLPSSAGERSTSSPGVARAATAARNAFARSRLSSFTHGHRVGFRVGRHATAAGGRTDRASLDPSAGQPRQRVTKPVARFDRRTAAWCKMPVAPLEPSGSGGAALSPPREELRCAPDDDRPDRTPARRDPRRGLLPGARGAARDDAARRPRRRRRQGRAARDRRRHARVGTAVRRRRRRLLPLAEPEQAFGRARPRRPTTAARPPAGSPSRSRRRRRELPPRADGAVRARSRLALGRAPGSRVLLAHGVRRGRARALVRATTSSCRRSRG